MTAPSASGPAAALVAAVVVVAVVGCSDGTEVKLRHTVATGASGIEVRYPSGWRPSTRNDTPVVNPALCFALSGRTNRGPVRVKVVEYLPPLVEHAPRTHRLEYAARPKHFRFAMLEAGDSKWIKGPSLSWQERGRVFFAGVEAHHPVAAHDRRAVEAIIDSIRVGPGRCRPTAGVGARRQ